MRRLISFVCGVAALIVGVWTLPAAWVAHNIANEDGYVSFTEPLARDRAFHATIARAVSGALVDRSVLPVALRPAATTTIFVATSRISDVDGFVQAWDATQRQSHRIMFGKPGTLPAELDASNKFAVDLGPLGQFVTKQISSGLPVQITAPKQMVLSVGGNVESQALEQISKTPTYARNGLLVMAPLTAVCLLLARKRGVAVAMLGVGLVGLAGLLHVLSAAVLPDLVDRNTASSSFAKAMINAVVNRADESFGHWLIGIAVIGVVAAVVGGASSLGFSARSKT